MFVDAVLVVCDVFDGCDGCDGCDGIFNQVAAGGSLQNVFVRLCRLGVMNPA